MTPFLQFIVVAAITASLFALGFWLLLRAVNTPPPAPAPVPMPPPPPAPTREPVRGKPRMVKIRLVSNAGRSLLRDKHTGKEILLDVPAHERRPSMTYRTSDGHLSVFNASHQDQWGVWIYRRMGVERE